MLESRSINFLRSFSVSLLHIKKCRPQVRSIKYQLAVAKLPLAKDIEDFNFADTLVNEPLIRDLAGGAFVADQRNVVLVGGTGTGKSHLAIAIAPTTALRRRRSTETHVRFAVGPVIRHANPVRITATSSPTKPGRYFLDKPAARNAGVRDRRWHTQQHKSP